MLRAARALATLSLLALILTGLPPAAASATSASDLAATLRASLPVPGPGFEERIEDAVAKDINVCSLAVAPGEARCQGRVRTDTAALGARPARPGAAPTAAGLGNNGAYDPPYLQSAYNLMAAIKAGAGAGQTVAIVDAYHDPHAESDMAYYRKYFNLPVCASTDGCFRQVGQNGGTSYPALDTTGWSYEIAIDVDMVSAICPSCHILLVEANSNYFSDLAAAVNTAVALGANVVGNSYGSTGGEWSGTASTNAAYNHPGVAITASTNDGGYGVVYPASLSYVTAVGGTSLNQTGNTGTRDPGQIETAWSGAGSGCSAYQSKPSWQNASWDSGCSRRSIADVSAVADPKTGVWIYNTYDVSGAGGFYVFGGTSVAAQIIGAIYALAANPASTDVLASYPYSHTAALFDVTSGSTGSCGGSYLCTAGPGYDGPTGLGTPLGIGAFTPPPTTPDFSMSANPPSVSVAPGSSITTTITFTASHNYSGTVTPSVTSTLPSGVTASFSPVTAWSNTGTATASTVLTLSASSTSPGSPPTALTIQGTDGLLTHTTSVMLTVVVPTFTIKASPSSSTVRHGSSGHYTVTVTSTSNYTSAVVLSIKGEPAGSSPTFLPGSIVPSSGGTTSALTVPTSSSTTRKTYTLTITATGPDGTTKSTNVSMRVD